MGRRRKRPAKLERLDVPNPEKIRRLALDRTDWTRRALLGKDRPFEALCVDAYVQGFTDAVQVMEGRDG